MIRLLVLTEFTNVTDGQTDTAWRHRPRLHSIARKMQTHHKATRWNFANSRRQRRPRPVSSLRLQC